MLLYFQNTMSVSGFTFFGTRPQVCLGEVSCITSDKTCPFPEIKPVHSVHSVTISSELESDYYLWSRRALRLFGAVVQEAMMQVRADEVLQKL